MPLIQASQNIALEVVPFKGGRSLARERDDERLRALCAEGAGEPEAEQPTREIPTKLLFDECRDRHNQHELIPTPVSIGSYAAPCFPVQEPAIRPIGWGGI